MFLETVRSEGLGHLSYVVGDGDRCGVIDPRRDAQVYVDIAHRHEARITHILETHRNEDYVTGATDLAALTGAEIYRGAARGDAYGQGASEGDVYHLGAVSLRVLETPGHTDDSLSFALVDRRAGPDAVGVFTGDALFVGDVGRTDFYPDRAEAVAGLLYDSLHRKLVPLGDGVIIYPAHTSGSVCGASLSDRTFSTIGHERRYNPGLAHGDRETFVAAKLAEDHVYPPYFRVMERYNQSGPPALPALPMPSPLDDTRLVTAMERGMIVVDTRDPEAWCGAHIPGSLAIPLESLPSHAGWFLPYDRPVGLVLRHQADLDTAVRMLVRLGFDDITGWLAGGLHAWEVAGRAFAHVRTVQALELKAAVEGQTAFTLLDVRRPDEFAAGHLPGARNIHVGELPGRLGELPRDLPVVTFCGSGQRAAVAAALLTDKGFPDLAVCLGSMAACSAVGCPVEKEAA